MELYKAQAESESVQRVIKNSETILEGAFAYITEDGAEEADAVTDYPAILAEGFRDKRNVQLGSGFSTSGTDFTGTFTQARTGNTYAASATNHDAAGDHVVVEGRLVTPNDVFSAELTATINTTTGSGKPGYYIAMSTSAANKLDETTATGTKTANTPFELVDNGQGENSAQDPLRRGNFVLFKVVHIQELSAA